MVRAGGGKYLDGFTSEPRPHISFGFGVKEDITSLTNVDQIQEKCREHNPDRLPLAGRFATQIWDFLHEIRSGDVILTPMVDHKWLRHGTVGQGSPYFEEKLHKDGGFLGHHRPVEWDQEPIYRYDCNPSDQGPMRKRRTIVLVADDSDAFWSRYSPGSGTRGSTKGNVGITQKTHNTLDDLLREFGWQDFQDLVGDLLAAMGCEILEISPPGPDDGVDIRAVSSDLLTPDVPLAVQVKRYKWEGTIHRKAVRELRSGIEFGGRGIFVTSSRFAKGAIEIATQPNYPYIALIDGPKLLALLSEHSEEISKEFQQRLEIIGITKASTP